VELCLLLLLFRLWTASPRLRTIRAPSSENLPLVSSGNGCRWSSDIVYLGPTWTPSSPVCAQRAIPSSEDFPPTSSGNGCRWSSDIVYFGPTRTPSSPVCAQRVTLRLRTSLLPPAAMAAGGARHRSPQPPPRLRTTRHHPSSETFPRASSGCGCCWCPPRVANRRIYGAAST